MRVLITGANGLLGRQLTSLLLQRSGVSVVATGKGEDRNSFLSNAYYSYHPLDLTDGVKANTFYLQQRPDVIIHAAAMTNVDECEQDKVRCWDINVTATRYLIDAAKMFNPYVLYISTDLVFDGEHGPYSEDAPTTPVNYYGSSKLAAEKAMIESGLSAAIVRTSLVYMDSYVGGRETIISRVKNSLLANKKIQMVADQWRNPTYVEDLAKGIWLLLQERVDGIFNISGKELLTPYDMAIQIAEYFGLDSTLIEKASSATFSQPAKRPVRIGLLLNKVIDRTGYAPISFTEALATFKKD